MEPLIRYLDTHSPVDILESEDILSAFRRFVSKAKGCQFVEFISRDQPQPDQPGLVVHLETPSTLLPARPSSPPPTPFQPLSPRHETGIRKSPPEEYFKSKPFQHLSRKRLKQLIKAATRLKEAADIPIKDLNNLWSSNNEQAPQTPSNDVFSRADKLYNTTVDLKKKRAVLDCASRFISLFIRHEVDVLASTGELGLSDAFEQIANQTQWSLEELKQTHYQAKNFVS